LEAKDFEEFKKIITPGNKYFAKLIDIDEEYSYFYCKKRANIELEELKNKLVSGIRDFFVNSNFRENLPGDDGYRKVFGKNINESKKKLWSDLDMVIKEMGLFIEDVTSWGKSKVSSWDDQKLDMLKNMYIKMLNLGYSMDELSR
jgi:hypothetical protein